MRAKCFPILQELVRSVPTRHLNTRLCVRFLSCRTPRTASTNASDNATSADMMVAQFTSSRRMILALCIAVHVRAHSPAARAPFDRVFRSRLLVYRSS